MSDYMTEWWFLIVMLLLLMLLVCAGIGMVVFVLVQATKRRDREDFDEGDSPAR